jgi:AcrR family transcriptional regulator
MQQYVAFTGNRIVNQLSTSSGSKARRPGGRTAEITHRVRDAIIDLLIDGGAQACTIKAVAKRAGIERSTLYRRFPDKWEAIIDALMARAAADVMPSLGDSFAEDLRSVLRKLKATLESPLGPALLAAAVELRTHDGGDYPRAYFDRRMAQLAPMFDAAIKRGELPASVDREALFTSAAGPIYFRMFIAGRAVDEDFIQSIVSSTCWLHCSPSAAAKLSLPARIA